MDAVQWVPGDGKPDQSKWPDVYRKIVKAGKGIQLFNGFDCIDAVAMQTGTYKGIHHMAIKGHISQELEFTSRIQKYSIGTKS